MTIKPLHDRVFVKRHPQEHSRGMLWIPDVARDNSQRATVLSVGDQVHGVKPGDVVLVPGAANKFPDWEQSDHIMIQVADIGGIFG